MDLIIVIVLVVVSIFFASISVLTVYLNRSDKVMGRGEFAKKVLASFVLAIVLRALVSSSPYGSFIGLMISVVFLILATNWSIYRCTDAGISRKVAILIGIPLFGFLVLVFLMLLRNDRELGLAEDVRD